MSEERRRYRRIKIKLAVDCTGEKILQSVEISNLSQGGMFIITDKIEEIGAPLEVIFEVGREEVRRIQASAVVAWVRKTPAAGLPSGMGVMFTKVFPVDGVKFLKELIDHWED
ncbi:MAG: hypothetical protein GY858_02105 [Candidatus Omnitrophica bacterium]|nr:hypothetical protein [Candidatus Omnitrophota bacterium]